MLPCDALASRTPANEHTSSCDVTRSTEQTHPPRAHLFHRMPEAHVRDVASTPHLGEQLDDSIGPPTTFPVTYFKENSSWIGAAEQNV